MWNAPSKERMQRIPELYTTEQTPLKDKLIYLHFFIGWCDWYVAESDGYGDFWGFVILNGDYENAEWGYFTLTELEQISIQGIEVDCELEEVWKVVPAYKVSKIARANDWFNLNEVATNLSSCEEV